MDFLASPLSKFPNHIGILILVQLLLITSFLHGPESCSATTLTDRCNFKAIFNFGDSNSDTGGLAAIFGQPPPPNGETFFHRPSGRFSDGRLMIDFMAQHLGFPYLSAYLDAVGSNFSHGANFATSGSTIRPQNKTYFQSGYSPISLDVQLTQFSDFYVRSQMVRKRGGVFEMLLPEEGQFSEALYTFDIGQNDFTAAYEIDNMTSKQVKSIVPDLLNQFSRVVKDIYGRGGRSFWIHNTGPIGCLAYIMVMERSQNTPGVVDQYGCASPYNDAAQYYNLAFKDTVSKLRKELPLAAITYVDIFSAKYFLITRAKKLGFEKPFQACCGLGGGKFNYDPSLPCWNQNVVNGTIETIKACKSPSTRIVWDGIHFTEAANKWISDHIINGTFSDPPIPLIHACHKLDS